MENFPDIFPIFLKFLTVPDRVDTLVKYMENNIQPQILKRDLKKMRASLSLSLSLSLCVCVCVCGVCVCVGGWWGEGLFLVKKTLWTLSSATKLPINAKLC